MPLGNPRTPRPVPLWSGISGRGTDALAHWLMVDFAAAAERVQAGAGVVESAI